MPKPTKSEFDFAMMNQKFNKDNVFDQISKMSSNTTPVSHHTASAGSHELCSWAVSWTPAYAESDDMIWCTHLHGGLQVPIASGYNKSSSFFDDISCETKERVESRQTRGGGGPGATGGQSRQSGRARMQQQRETDLQTFGETHPQS
jgi:hypothetical protein